MTKLGKLIGGVLIAVAGGAVAATVKTIKARKEEENEIEVIEEEA